MPVADDDALVRGLRGSDPRSTREAWYRFGPIVRRLLLWALGANPELDDRSHDVFITFFDRVQTLRDPRTVTAFVMSITALRIRERQVGDRRGRPDQVSPPLRQLRLERGEQLPGRREGAFVVQPGPER